MYPEPRLEPASGRPHLRHLLALGPIVGLLHSGLYYFFYGFQDEPVLWNRLLWSLFTYCLWVPLTPLVIAAARCHPLAGPGWRRNALWHAGYMLASVVLIDATYLTIRYGLTFLTGWQPYDLSILAKHYPSGMGSSTC